LSLILWEEGAEGPKGLLLGKRYNPIYKPSRCFTQGFPKKAMKNLFVRKGGPTRIMIMND
jgi:hypothetical protein